MSLALTDWKQKNRATENVRCVFLLGIHTQDNEFFPVCFQPRSNSDSWLFFPDCHNPYHTHLEKVGTHWPILHSALPAACAGKAEPQTSGVTTCSEIFVPQTWWFFYSVTECPLTVSVWVYDSEYVQNFLLQMLLIFKIRIENNFQDSSHAIKDSLFHSTGSDIHNSPNLEISADLTS